MLPPLVKTKKHLAYYTTKRKKIQPLTKKCSLKRGIIPRKLMKKISPVQLIFCEKGYTI
ncbi:hypothetical protein BREVNS_2359 [Brevinematales bacterium NS]|nr:hypothetical protein BREVNS_2359 [Brevinematales bacterium NS]